MLKYFGIPLIILGAFAIPGNDNNPIYGLVGKNILDTNDSFEAARGFRPDSSYPCQQEKADTSMFGIKLDNSASVIKILGNIQGQTWEYEGSHPRFTIYNKFENESLILIFHEGDFENEFSEFEIKSGKYEKSNRNSNRKFTSGLGIKLGMNESEVIKKIGKCYKIEKKKNGNKLILYHIDDMKHSKLLRRHNMPEYYTECEFRNNKLLRYRFGFYYP